MNHLLMRSCREQHDCIVLRWSASGWLPVLSALSAPGRCHVLAEIGDCFCEGQICERTLSQQAAETCDFTFFAKFADCVWKNKFCAKGRYRNRRPVSVV